MAPTILDGDIILVNKTAYKWSRRPKRGDIVLVIPRTTPVKIVKRVVGLPFERLEITDSGIEIKNNRLDLGSLASEPYLQFIDTPRIGIDVINIDPKEYFLLGDNRYVSIDSRELGPVDEWDIKGRVILSLSFKNLTIKRF